MKTFLRNQPAGETRRAGLCLPGGWLLVSLLGTAPVPAVADDSFQMNALFNPGKAQLQAEARGRVMIYDGLDEETVERALDEQFERIDHMMFIRTRRAGPEGAVIVTDDDC